MNIMNIKDFLPPQEPPKPELKKRIITLTNRAPIAIIEEHWPFIAEGVSYDLSTSEYGEYGVVVKFKVRRHVDINKPTFFGSRNRYYSTCYIIHAKFWNDHPAYDPAEQSDPIVRVGRTLTGPQAMSDLWKHMCEVADELRERIGNKDMHRHITRALDDAFAKLQPQDMP
jgi:hypothetical protein